MKTITTILTLLLTVCAIPPAFSQTDYDLPSILLELDRKLEQRDAYVAQRQASIDSLTARLATTSDPAARVALLRTIGNRYYNFQVDSALCYFSRGMDEAARAGLEADHQSLDLAYTSLLPVNGAVHEAINHFESIDTAAIFPANRQAYAEQGARMYFFATDYYRVDSLRLGYANKGLALSLSMLPMVEPGTVDHQFYTEVNRYYRLRDQATAVANLEHLLSNIHPDNPYYSRVAMALNTHYQAVGNDDRALYYLALAAISDVSAGVREETALLSIGRALFGRGDIERAYRYFTTSTRNAVESGAISRSIVSSLYLPNVVEVENRVERNRYHMMLALVGALLLALVALSIVLVINRREHRRLHRVKDLLAESNRVKESYISQFLNLSGIHLERQEEMRRLVLRKLKAQQADDLVRQLSSSNYKAESQASFYETFDAAFLHIFPHFFDGVNKLLQPDKQIRRPENRQLNTELRILAFMRLGIDDSNSIARFLGVSINTIYTYRNKFRSSALSRDTFERQLLTIDSIPEG